MSHSNPASPCRADFCQAEHPLLKEHYAGPYFVVLQPTKPHLEGVLVKIALFAEIH